MAERPRPEPTPTPTQTSPEPVLSETQNILVVLRNSGWTVRNIAQALSISERQVWRWWRGESEPLLVFLVMLRTLKPK